MQTSSSTTQLHPVLPAPLSLPFKFIPSFVHNKALVTALNRIFYKDLEEGELDFLHGKVVQISVEDAGIEYRFTLNKEKLAPANKNQSADIFLKGTIHDYLLLASRREDTDTLFFNRRLHMQGDTELGLYIKNFLDGLDMETHKLPAMMESSIKKVLPFYERFFSGKS